MDAARRFADGKPAHSKTPPAPPLREKAHTRASPARRAAWALLTALRTERSPSPLPVMLDACSRRHKLDARDTGLCMELVYGVLRTERRLEHALLPFLARPEALPAELRQLLLMGAYALLFLDAIPAWATVNEATGLARRSFGRALANLVNAVLRNVDRQAARLREADALFMARPDPYPAGEPGEGPDSGRAVLTERIARAGSLPTWLAAQWAEQYGPDKAWDLARRSAERPSLCWRLNLRRADHEEAAAALSGAGAMRAGDAAFCFAACDPVFMVPPAAGGHRDLEHQGRISRQGAGSILMAERLAARILSTPSLADKALWDACCGRGGKSLALLERGVHVALCSDPSAARLEALARDLRRLALPVPRLERGTAQSLAPGRSFALILLDLPCSGSGTLARNPELRLRLTPERMRELTALQAGILEGAWPALEPGGLLAYMTCSLNREENQGQVEGFMARHPDCAAPEYYAQYPVLSGQDSLFMAFFAKRNN